MSFLPKTDAVHAFTAGSHGSGEVVSPDTVGNPLLLAIDNEVLAVFAEPGLASQVGNITTSIWLRNGQADALITGENTRHDAVLEGLRTKLHDGRTANTETTNQVPDETTGAGTRQLVGQQHLVEEIPVFRGDRLDTIRDILGRVLDPQETPKIATAAHLLVDLLGDALSLVPLSDVRFNLVLHPLADFGTQSGVSLVEVWREVALVPRRISKGDQGSEGLQRLRLLIAGAGAGGLLRSGCGGRLGLGLGLRLGLAVERADLQLALVLFQDALVVVFPEDFGGVLASDSLENLLAACAA
ncbi:hypothetical protein E5D57_001011 [Metarhizium anisopliae]|nr:hypothetical protein E5D57_001011 [Metarhizium anisopliae]